MATRAYLVKCERDQGTDFGHFEEPAVANNLMDDIAYLRACHFDGHMFADYQGPLGWLCQINTDDGVDE